MIAIMNDGMGTALLFSIARLLLRLASPVDVDLHPKETDYCTAPAFFTNIEGPLDLFHVVIIFITNTTTTVTMPTAVLHPEGR